MADHAGARSWLRSWRREALSDEWRVMQLVVALACLFVTASIGFTYARDIGVAGWQLWTWLVSVVVAVSVLLAGSGRPAVARDHKWRWLALLLLVALLLRFVLLGSVPGGLHVDEAGLADFSLRHVFPEDSLTVNPFRAGPASQPSLYHYLIRLSLATAGNSITGLRLSSALAGVLGVLATYAVVAVYGNRRAALISAVLMTAYHYHVHWSRLGLNNIWDTLWVPLILALFAWGWKRKWRGGAVLAGLALGLSQYFYAGSKIGIFLLAFIIWQCWRGSREMPGERRRLASYAGLLALTAVIVAAPIFFFAVRDPGTFFERSRTVFAWQPEPIAIAIGDTPNYLAYGWRQLWRSVGAFTTVPDVTGFYGPGVPLLIGLAAPLFLIGLFWAIYKRQFVPVMWVALTVILGGFLVTDPPGSSHYVVVIPAVCWLMALPLEWLWSKGHGRLVLALLIVVVITDLYFYFGIYVPGNPRDLIHTFPPWPS